MVYRQRAGGAAGGSCPPYLHAGRPRRTDCQGFSLPSGAYRRGLVPGLGERKGRIRPAGALLFLGVLLPTAALIALLLAAGLLGGATLLGEKKGSGVVRT